MMNIRDIGIAIVGERTRQITEEGWSDDHDDLHVNGELAQAAAVYAWPEPRPVLVKKAWPWPGIPKYTVPDSGLRFTPEEALTARRRDLIKAAALIMAEVQRIDRLRERLARTNPETGELSEEDRKAILEWLMIG